MKELAAACGVSVATVSKALNDQKDVSARTKEMVRRRAKELGYFPNAAAKALKTNRSYNIGVLFIDEAQNGLTHDYFAHILDSFKRRIEEGGFDLTLFGGAGNFGRPMTLLEKTRYRGFDGVIIACIDFTDPQVLELVNSDVPVVTIDYIYNNRIAVISDNVSGMQDLVQYVYGRGHRKIAYIHGADSSVTQARLSSFYTTAAQLGLEIPEAYIKEAAYRSTKEVYEKTAELLELKDRPTCILFPDDFASIGGMNAIRDAGLSIPEDISIAGYDGLRMGRHMSPQLTTVRQDTETIGRIAGEKLVELIESPRSTIIQPIIVEGTLVEGGTVADIN